MSRLEEKLEELGYTQSCRTIYLYFKSTKICSIYVYLNSDRTKCDSQLERIGNIHYQEQLNDLQQAFNIMKEDLEELKNVKS